MKKVKQFTKKEAIALHDSGGWKILPSKELFALQLQQDRLFVPWEAFHKAAEEALGRPVFTHEFVDREGLLAEFEGRVAAPSLDEIIAKLPSDKTIVVTT